MRISRVFASAGLLCLIGLVFPAAGQELATKQAEPATRRIDALLEGNSKVVVSQEEWDKEMGRLQSKVAKANEEMEILETLLAKNKADAESAGLELKLYLLTHATSQPPGEPPGPREGELQLPGAPAPAADMAVETFKGRVVGPDSNTLNRNQ